MTSKRLRVLIVDDEPSVANSLAMIIDRSGHNALPVYSGNDAIDTARGFNPQVVLSDVTMPGIDGIELARCLAADYPGCKILLMSGNDEGVNTALECLTRRECAKVLTKPIPPQAILAFISEVTECS